MKRHRIISLCYWLQTILILLIIACAFIKAISVDNAESLHIAHEIISIFTFYGWGIGALLFLQAIINYNKKLLRRMHNSRFAKWFN